MKAAVDLKPTLTIIKTEKVDLELFPSPGEWRQRGPHPSFGSPSLPLWVALLPQEPRIQRPGGLLVAQDPCVWGSFFFFKWGGDVFIFTAAFFVTNGKKLIEFPAP